MPEIIVVDDNETMREGNAYVLRTMGKRSVLKTASFQKALLSISEETKLVITEIGAKVDCYDDGLNFVEQCCGAGIPVFVVTRFFNTELASVLAQKGAWPVGKPFAMHRLALIVEELLRFSETVPAISPEKEFERKLNHVALLSNSRIEGDEFIHEYGEKGRIRWSEGKIDTDAQRKPVPEYPGYLQMINNYLHSDRMKKK